MPVRAIVICIMLACLVTACAAHADTVAAMRERASSETSVDLASPTLTALGEGVWEHRSWRRSASGTLQSVNGLLVTRGEYGFLIDAPWTTEQAEALVRQAHAMGVTIYAALLTQAHDERAAVLAALAQAHDLVTYSIAHTQVEARLRRMPQSTRLLPVAGRLFVALTAVEYFYPGPGHSHDNLVVYLPGQHILFGGETVRALADGLGVRGEADLVPWRTATERIEARFPKATVIVPAAGATGDRTLLSHTKALLNVALADISGRFGGG